MKAFGNNKRNISSSERINELKSVTQYKFVKELAESRCKYVNNTTLNKNFTIDYGYNNDSLVGYIRNVDSYNTFLQLAKGHNICSCNTDDYNTEGNLAEGQEYGYQDLSGIILYDACGNKLFDDAFFNMCNDIDYTNYETAITGENRITNKNNFLTNFNYPKRIQLMSEYAKPELLLYSAIPTTNYYISLRNIVLKTDIDRCFETDIIVNNVNINLYRRIVTKTVVTETDIIKTYDIEYINPITGIITGDLVSTPTSTYINTFSNININKPSIDYFFSFTNPDVPDICSNYFNVYANFNRFVAKGLYNTEILNTAFTDLETQNQGATTGRVTFSPTISGDYFYQSKYNNNVFGQIDILDTPTGHVDISNFYTIDLEPSYPHSIYFLTVSGETTRISSPTITAYAGDTIIFDICSNQTFTEHPLYIQMEQGAPIHTTIVEDASGIMGVAGQVIETISMEIMDNHNNRFTRADNTVNIKIDSTTNLNNADLSGTTTKSATEGTVIFDDLIITRPGTKYKFLIYTNDGEIIQSYTPEFSILGTLLFISSSDDRQYIVGEDISNIGTQMENGSFDNSTEIAVTLNNGTLDTGTSYSTTIEPEMSGNTLVTLENGQMYTDISINKIGFNYSFNFDASNILTPLVSETFNIVGQLDMSNSLDISSTEKTTMKSGTDLSNFQLELQDINNNVIPFNGNVNINILTLDVSNNISSLRTSTTAQMTDGSLNLSGVSIDVTGSNFFLEFGMNEADAPKTSGLIDITADIDISAQPFRYADRIYGQDLNSFTAKAINVNNDPLVNIDLSFEVDFAQSQQGAILQGDSTVDTSGGYAIFDDIELLAIVPIKESRTLNLEVSGRNPEDNLAPFTTNEFTILYTNWNTNTKNQVAPGIPSVSAVDHIIHVAGSYYLPFDSSFVVVKGADPSNNSPHWKTNDTGYDGDYMRSMVWDISYQELAGAIFRIQRKLYTEDISNEEHNNNADFSCTPLFEIEASSQESRNPYTYYYDYSFNSTYLTRLDHSNNAHTMFFDDTIYDGSWSLVTFRNETETNVVSAKLKLDASNIIDVSENCDYFIAGKMDICANANPDYNNILYSWDVSGEYEHYIWVGPTTKIN